MRTNERCVTVRLRIEGVWIMSMQVCASIDKDDVDKDILWICTYNYEISHMVILPTLYI